MTQWAIFFHIILASLWIGGMLFTVLVLVPVSRSALFQNRRGAFFAEVGTLFSRYSWGVFLLMVVTGVLALFGMGYGLSDLTSSWFWSSPYGKTLMGKLHLLSLVLIISGVHDFWLGPKAARLMDQEPESSRTMRLRKAASWVGRINLLLGLLIVWYAVQLVRGPGLL